MVAIVTNATTMLATRCCNNTAINISKVDKLANCQKFIYGGAVYDMVPAPRHILIAGNADHSQYLRHNDGGASSSSRSHESKLGQFATQQQDLL